MSIRIAQWLCIFALVSGLPSLSLGGDCNPPVLLPDERIHDLWLEHHVATKDTELLSPPGMGGCLDTGDLKEALTGEPPAGSFQQGLERSRLENRMGEILRRVHRDPNAQVYLCPGEGPELKYNVVSSQAVSAIANKTHKPADWVKRIFDRGFLESQCRRVPKVDVAHLHDSIPPGLLVFLLKHLPDLEGKPFPPQAEPDLNLTAPIEPAEPEKPTPPLM